MINVDLITGPLGAGKTTFITEYASYIARTKKTAVIVNDYGAINVDRLFLEERIGDRCHLEMVIGGDPDCSRRRLKTKLIALAMDKYEHVIVEPSGIFEAGDFIDMLFEEPLDKWYRINSVIALVEAGTDFNMSYEAKYVLASEISKAGAVLVSKGEPAENMIENLNSCLEAFSCTRRVERLEKYTPNEMPDEFYEGLTHAGYNSGEMIRLPIIEEGAFKSHFFFHVNFPVSEIRDRVEKIFADESCGNVIRLKGFIKNKFDQWLEVNATKSEIRVQPISVGQDLFIFIGENIDPEKINEYIK